MRLEGGDGQALVRVRVRVKVRVRVRVRVTVTVRVSGKRRPSDLPPHSLWSAAYHPLPPTLARQRRVLTRRCRSGLPG